MLSVEFKDPPDRDNIIFSEFENYEYFYVVHGH